MIEFYEYDGQAYDFVGAIDGGEVVEGDEEQLDFVFDFVEATDEVDIGDEDAVVDRVSNEYFMGVIPTNGGTTAEAVLDEESEGGDGSSHDYGPELKLKQAAKNDLETACDVLFEAHQHLIWPDLVEQRAEEPFWDRDEEMPQFVEAAIREALRGGAISAISEHLPVGTTRADVRSFFEDQLRQPQGWSLRSLTQNYAQRFGVSEDEAVTAVRTQTSNILNEARAEGYRAQGDVDDREFKWLGPSDARTTEACERLKAETNPDYGGEPVTLDELRQLVTEVRRDAFPEFRGADWTVHWNERHTYVEHFD